MELKRCTRCKEDKESTTANFAPVKSRSRGLRKRAGKLLASYCRPCMVKYQKAHYANNKVKWETAYAARSEEQKEATRVRVAAYARKFPEKVRAAVKRCYNPSKKFARELRVRYGLTVEQYNELRAQQGEACAICRVKPNARLVVDHCHKTGRVRGLLCGECNLALGKFRDDPAVVEAALHYLQQPQVRLVKEQPDLRLIAGGK